MLHKGNDCKGSVEKSLVVNLKGLGSKTNKRTRVREAEESPLKEPVARKRLVGTVIDL
jgi:hypothetical protein